MGFCIFDELCAAVDSTGFWYGAALGVVLAFLLWCFLKLFFGRRSGCQSLRVEDAGGGGAFVLSAQAMKSFLQWIAADYPELDLRQSKIKTLRDGVSLEIVFNVVPGAELARIRQEFRTRLFKEIESRLGVIDQIKQINIEVDGYDARPERIAKQKRNIKGVETEFDEEEMDDGR